MLFGPWQHQCARFDKTAWIEIPRVTQITCEPRATAQIIKIISIHKIISHSKLSLISFARYSCRRENFVRLHAFLLVSGKCMDNSVWEFMNEFATNDFSWWYSNDRYYFWMKTSYYSVNSKRCINNFENKYFSLDSFYSFSFTLIFFQNEIMFSKVINEWINFFYPKKR